MTTRGGEWLRRAKRATRLAALRAFYAVVGDARRARTSRPVHARVRGPLEAIALFPSMARAVLADPSLRRYALSVHGARIAIVVLLTAVYATVAARTARPPAPPSDDETVEELRAIEVGSFKVPLPDQANVKVKRTTKAAPEAPARRAEPAAHTEKRRKTRLDGWGERVVARFPWLPLLSGIYAFAVFVEWIVIALSRQYDDELARRTSLALGVLPEDEPRTPRPSFDPKWAFRKLRDRVRGSLLLVSAFPLYVLLDATHFGKLVAPVLVVGWGLYWGLVFTAAKSAHAWRDADADPPAPLPFFLRPFERAMHTHPRLTAYPRAWAFLVRSVRSPAHHAERSLGAFFGVLFVRALSHVPLVYLAIRPFVAVASARIIAGHDPRARLAAPGHRTTLGYGERPSDAGEVVPVPAPGPGFAVARVPTSI